MYNPWINYHHLYYFKTITEEGSVSNAAKKILVGQPTLSAQLKQFEENIGVQLFVREHKKLIITEHGEVALDYAKNIFKMGSEMYEVLHDSVKPHKPNLHIGALDSVPKQVILSLTKSALMISPYLVTLSEGGPDELLRELFGYRIDLVVTNFLPSGVDAKGISPKHIAKNNVAIYASPKFKKLRKVFSRSISSHPLVFPTYDSQLRLDLNHWSELNDIDLNIVVESQDVAVKKLMPVNEIGKLKGVHEELYLLSAQRKISNSLADKITETFSA